MMRLENVSVTEVKSRILRNVTLSVTPGITVLLGENGSGKTTLLRCAAGLRKFEGRVLLDGTDARTLSPGERARRISLLPQSLPAPNIPVETLVSFGRRPWAPYTGRLSREDLGKRDEAILRMGLEPLRHAFLPTLSGGELQKAYFAMLLAQDGDIVLLDEPASHLDGSASAFLAKELCTLRDMGKAVFCVMHDVTGAAELADHFAVLQNGELVFSGDREAFLSQKIPERFLHLTRYRAEDENGNSRSFFR